MRSYLLVEAEKIELKEVPIPEPRDDEVLIKVMACGICSRTDLVYYKYCFKKDHCRPEHFGHEICGIVEAVGKGVKSVAPGERVFSRSRVDTNSGFSEYCLAKEYMLGRVPEDLPFTEGVLGQLLSIATNGIRGVNLGDCVVIFGQGSAGLLLTQLARLRGAARVITADRYEKRLSVSRELGADVAVNVDRENIKDALEGLLPDVVIDAVGIPSVIKQCIDLVKPAGIVSIFGTYHLEPEVTLNLFQWEGKSINIMMASEGSSEITQKMVKTAERLLAAKRIETKPIVTHTFPLERLPEALKLLEKSPLLVDEKTAAWMPLVPLEAIKVVIEPQK